MLAFKIKHLDTVMCDIADKHFVSGRDCQPHRLKHKLFPECSYKCTVQLKALNHVSVRNIQHFFVNDHVGR